MRTSHLLLAAAVTGILAGGLAQAEDAAPAPKEGSAPAKDGTATDPKADPKAGAKDAKAGADKNGCSGKDGCKTPAAKDEGGKKAEKTDTDKNSCGGKDGCGAKK